jgi:TPR repeat protein
MQIQQARRILLGVVTTVMFVFGATPIQAGSAASNRGASAIAALDAIPAEDWLKQSSGALLDRVIAASSKESLDAAATRDPRAQALVGSAYLAGLHGYAKSEAEAVKFYRLAADSNPIAQNNLGNLLLTGVANGSKPAPAEAAEMFRRAAKLGHPVAQSNLGKLYADGVGVAKDVAKAREFLALAAAQGNQDAVNFLAVLEAREAAQANAEKWKRLDAAAATGDADALRALAEAYEALDNEAFEAIKSNQLQAAINTIVRAPDRERLRFAELADEHGMTALHWTVTNGNAAGLRWLLDKGADLEPKDDRGRTPLKIALDNHDTRAMTILIDRGARPSTALSGHDGELKALRKTNDIVDFMMKTAAANATKPPPPTAGAPTNDVVTATVFAAAQEPASQSRTPIAGSAAATGSASTGFAVLRVRLGVDTVASVERDIRARGGSPITGGSGGVAKFRLSAMSGDYSEIGPGVMAVNYEFDAAGPAGRLIAVSVSRNANSGVPYAKLAADRKAALAKVFGVLKPKSAAESTGSAGGCELTLYENPAGGWLYETYRLPN